MRQAKVFLNEVRLKMQNAANAVVLSRNNLDGLDVGGLVGSSGHPQWLPSMTRTIGLPVVARTSVSRN